MLTTHDIRTRFRRQARRLDRLSAALLGSPEDRLAVYRADPARLMVDAGYTPDPWQAEFLRADDARHLMLCSRQCGKTLVVSFKALHTVLTRPDSTTVVLAQREFQAAELLRKVVTAYHRVGAPVPVRRDGATYLELANRARVFVLPAKESAVNGPTADLLIIDEAARVPDEVFIAASPQLSVSKGRLVALSTAFVSSGWFHDEYTKGAGYRRWSITARECPRHSPAFLAGERRAMGERWFNAAYLNVWGDPFGAVFSSADIDRAVSPDVLPLFPEFAATGTAAIGDPTVTPLFGIPT